MITEQRGVRITSQHRYGVDIGGISVTNENGQIMVKMNPFEKMTVLGEKSCMQNSQE